MMATSNEPTIDPTKEYSPETMAAMEQAVAANNARKEAAKQEIRKAYKLKIDSLAATPEFILVLNQLEALYSDENRDDIYSFYVEAARLNLTRLTGK